MRIPVVLLLMLIAAPVGAQTTARERVDQALILTTAAGSSIALGLTLSCTASHDCRELNPVMRKFLDKGPTTIAIVKSAGTSAALYAIWRFGHQHRKARTIALASMAAITTFDAVHDIRKMRKIERRKTLTIAFVF